MELLPIHQLEISIRWPNGDEFKSRQVFDSEQVMCGNLRNQVLLAAIETVIESGIASGYVYGSAKGVPVVEPV